MRGKVQGKAEDAIIGTADADADADTDDPSPWIEGAEVDRVDEAPSLEPPAYGVVTWS